MSLDEKAAPPTITTLSSREVYRNRWMRLREDQILRSNGKKGIYGVVEKEDAAIIIPVDHGVVWLVEQFRYTILVRALELPQGGWEEDVESAEEIARGGLSSFVTPFWSVRWSCRRAAGKKRSRARRNWPAAS